MKKYCLNDNDYDIIYERAVKEFQSTSFAYDTNFKHTLVQCTVESFLLFLNQQKLVVRGGNIYETEKE